MPGTILLWGLVIGIIHFLILSLLYLNPLVARAYAQAQEKPVMRQWDSQGKYVATMFLGTQVEIWALTTGYLTLRTLFPQPHTWETALLLGALFTVIRVYPRFFNMWMQTSYPRTLLAVEAVNGTIGTFVVVLGLKLLVP